MRVCIPVSKISLQPENLTAKSECVKTFSPRLFICAVCSLFCCQHSSVCFPDHSGGKMFSVARSGLVRFSSQVRLGPSVSGWTRFRPSSLESERFGSDVFWCSQVHVFLKCLALESHNCLFNGSFYVHVETRLCCSWIRVKWVLQFQMF